MYLAQIIAYHAIKILNVYPANKNILSIQMDNAQNVQIIVINVLMEHLASYVYQGILLIKILVYV